VAYPDLIDAHTGLNQLSDHWLLAYMYLNPGEGFDKRYLVFRPVDISWSRAPGEPQVGEMLAHWYDAAQHDDWATTAPVPGNYSAYKLVAQLGYTMTAPDSKTRGPHPDSKGSLRNPRLPSFTQRWIHLQGRPAEHTAAIPLLLRQ
jgi:hypothetical protein